MGWRASEFLPCARPRAFPASFESALSRVGLWTLSQHVVAADVEGLVETAQIQQSVVWRAPDLYDLLNKSRSWYVLLIR